MAGGGGPREVTRLGEEAGKRGGSGGRRGKSPQAKLRARLLLREHGTGQQRGDGAPRSKVPGSCQAEDQ